MDRSHEIGTGSARIRTELTDKATLLVRFSGPWRLEEDLPSPSSVLERVTSGKEIRYAQLIGDEITEWDSGLTTFLLRLHDELTGLNVEIRDDDLPDGVKGLLKLATAVPRKDTGADTLTKPLVERVGAATMRITETASDMAGFLGESCLALVDLVLGKASFRRSDFGLLIQDCGARALPIVTLISILVGMILAFVGAVQLKMFGAEIYIANLVGLGMAREMGAMMTGIILAGRTGASFAAQLGSMQVNEEIDALSTLGISAMDFLVLPRMLALALMMPLLCVYADFMGMVGGAMVGVGVFGLSPIQYFNQTKLWLTLVDLEVGIFKSVVFGALIALSGCYYGIRCGRSSEAVGIATTSAVVSAIVLIVMSDSLITFITTVIGI